MARNDEQRGSVEWDLHEGVISFAIISVAREKRATRSAGDPLPFPRIQARRENGGE